MRLQLKTGSYFSNNYNKFLEEAKINGYISNVVKRINFLEINGILTILPYFYSVQQKIT